MVLGLTVALTGFVLDCVAIIPLDGGPAIMLGYLESAPYWVAVALVFLGCAFVGAWKGRIQRSERGARNWGFKKNKGAQ